MAKARKRKSMRDALKKQAISDGGGIPWINSGMPLYKTKLPPEKNKFDILPYVITDKNHTHMGVGDSWYSKEVHIHYGLGAEGKESRVCPLKTPTIKKPCPVCEYRSNIMRTEDVDDKEIKKILNDLRPTHRGMYNVRVKGTKEINLLVITHGNFGRLLLEEIRDDEELETFAELEGGKTLTVKFREASFGATKYHEAAKIEFSDRKNIPESILKKTADLDAIIVVESYEDIEKVLFETVSAPETKKKKKKKTDEPDDDEETCDECGEELDECTCDDEDDDADEDVTEEDEDVTEEDECPHGHNFPKSCDKKEECDDCENWEYCREQADKLKKKK